MESTYKSKIYNIAVNTFEVTCYMFPVESWEAGANKKSVPDENIRSVVSFYGAANGRIVISPTENILEALAVNMLGIEEPDANQKKGALGEIANIICGNTVPLFAREDDICYINPPEILEKGERLEEVDQGATQEFINVLLNEGAVEISISYSLGDGS